MFGYRAGFKLRGKAGMFGKTMLVVTCWVQYYDGGRSMN
jgi:hypothetical protein